MKISRRKALIASALSFGSLPLRSLVTGLPASLLTSHSIASGSVRPLPNYLILSHQQAGDPANANVPGTYADDPNDSADLFNQIEHARVSELGDIAAGFETPASFTVGNQTVKAAQAWSTLAADLRQNFAFWHHGTFASAHPDFPSVRRFNGAIKGYNGSGTDEYGAFVAQENAQSLGTLSSESITVGGTAVKANGRTLPVLKPTDIKGLFSSTINNVDLMVKLRDSFIDRAYKEVKESGTPAQKNFLDKYARSQSEAAQMGDTLGSLITDVDGNDSLNQAKVAVALLQLNIAPVVTMGLRFGRDNHQDGDLADEVAQTNQSMLAINMLWDRLKAAQLEERVVFSSLNVFGRTLLRNKTGGRNHWSQHHCMFTFGPTIKGGVIGGLEPSMRNGKLRDFSAMGINSATGQGDNNNDIPRSETLVAVGKTLASAVGIEQERIDKRLDGGKVISAALV